MQKPVNFYDSHHRSLGFRNAPYVSSLPILISGGIGDVGFAVATPRFGYSIPELWDRVPKAPQVAFDTLIPLEAAIRISYESLWLGQATVIGGWVDEFASQVVGLIFHLGADLTIAISRGEAIPILEALRIIKDQVNAFELHRNLQELFFLQIQRMKDNCLLDKRGRTYFQRLTSLDRVPDEPINLPPGQR